MSYLKKMYSWKKKYGFTKSELAMGVLYFELIRRVMLFAGKKIIEQSEELIGHEPSSYFTNIIIPGFSIFYASQTAFRPVYNSKKKKTAKIGINE